MVFVFVLWQNDTKSTNVDCVWTFITPASAISGCGGAIGAVSP